MSPSKKSGSGRRSGVQDSTGSATGTTGNTEDIPMDELDDGKYICDNEQCSLLLQALIKYHLLIL